MLILISVLSILLLFFAYFCIKFALIIIKMQDDLEYALDDVREYADGGEAESYIEDALSELNDLKVFATAMKKKYVREGEDSMLYDMAISQAQYITKLINHRKNLK